jgi:cytochrome P450
MFLHRDPRSFTNPGLFVPERWDDEKRDPTWNHDVRGYIPFSAGQYVCPGKALAYLEMRFFLVRMLRDFEFEMSPDFDQEALWLGLKSYMGWFKPPIPLTVRKRDRARRPIVEAL